MTHDLQDLAARLDRVESMQAIGQLPIRYALAVDSRDLDTWLNLFVDDVDCGRRGRGREALRSYIAPAVAQFYRSIHQICGHRIVLDDPDHAHGVVYCRAEHEVGGQWVVMAIAYFDTYERREGEWYFVRREEKHWFSVDVLTRPGPPFHRWPERQAEPKLPADFPTWATFWQSMTSEQVAALTDKPVAS